MRPTLILQPIHNSSADILKQFAMGKPLTPEQHHFLEWHEKQLSNGWYDPILQYYLGKHHPQILHTSFLLPHEVINAESIKLLNKRIHDALKAKQHPVISLSYEQYVQFKEYTIRDLILWHGNQFLTGAPFYPGGTPPVIYFQWGNLFGITKFIVLPGEKTLKNNLLVYFEDMQERDLEQCVQEYKLRLDNEIKVQNQLTLQNKEIEVATHSNTPTLSPSQYFLVNHL